MKKGQFAGQVFVYILAIILTAVILGYGYNAIVTFKQKSDQVSYIKFKTDLQNAVETITSDFGSVKIIDLSLPSNFRKVCFVETYPTKTPKIISDDDYPIISDSTSSNTEKNVFLVENVARDSFYVGKIQVDGDFDCVDTIGGKIKLRLEGKGDHALIRDIPFG